MSNICSLGITLAFETATSAKAFEVAMRGQINQNSLYIGSSRYLFEVDVNEHVGNQLNIYGYVKNILTPSEAVDFIKYIDQLIKLKSAEILYEEAECNLFGKYLYKEGLLEQLYVSYNHAVWQHEDIYVFMELLYEELEKTLEKDGKKQVIELN